MVEQTDVFADLRAEAAELDRLLAGLDADQWEVPTPAPGWTVAHQVAHLAATFSLAGAAADPPRFAAIASRFGPDFEANVAAALTPYLALPRPALRARWTAELDTALDALATVPRDSTVPWLVRPLPPTVLVSAGVMEVFAHGQDIADAVGVRPERTDRLRHLVAFAVRTWDTAYVTHGLELPAEPFRFEVTAPSGALWEYGPADAADRITGPAEDLCLLVTRRRHRDDLAVTATGAEAERWLDIAQAYRGPAGPGRRPGQFDTQPVGSVA